MLRFKLIPTRDKATYLIKVNNKIIDHGILYTNDTPVWSQREPITLEYKGITFKDSKKNDYISISCTNAGSGREIYIQEIHVDDIEVIAEGLGVSYREDANFHVEHIVSGCSRNLDAVMTHDYSDVVILDRAGIMGDWIVVVKQPSGHVACWDEHLYFEKDNITFKEPGYYLDVINELRKQDKERQEQEQKARKAEEEAAQLEKEKEDKKIAGGAEEDRRGGHDCRRETGAAD